VADDSMTFPSDWPEGCPSRDAQPASGEVFACCATNPPGPLDFRTAHDRGYRPDSDPCQRRGLSVSLTRTDAESVRERFPRKYKFVVVAKLRPEHGRIMPTQGPTNTHHTLWKYEHVSFHTLFQVLS
jgi:hypothetical protein